EATQPLLKKIEHLEQTNNALTETVQLLTRTTTTQATKINKLSSDSQQIKKKLITATTQQITTEQQKPTSYAAAAAKNTAKVPKGSDKNTQLTSTARTNNTTATNTSHTNQQAPQTTTLQQRRFFITRNNNSILNAAQHVNIKETINETLRDESPVNNKLMVVTIRDTLRGNLEITTREDCTAEQVLNYSTVLLKALQQLPFGITSLLPNSPWAKVAVHGIDLAFFEDTKEGMERLQQEIIRNNPDIKLRTAPRYLTSPTQRAS